MPTGVFLFGDCRLEAPTHQLMRAGQRVSLRRVVFDLIAYLLRIRPRVATRHELAEQVWKRTDVSPGVIAKAVMEARRAIGDSGTEPEMIVSLHGLGYRFAGAVKEGTDSAALPEDDVAASVQQAVERAYRALTMGDHALAQLEAEHALMQADAGGVNRTRIDAMLCCARVATITGPADRMMRLSDAALRLAQAERLPDLVCAAQVGLASAHMTQGSSLVALDLLKAAIPVLQSSGPVAQLLGAESLMHMAHSDLQHFDEALVWCHRAQATAKQLGRPTFLHRERNNEIALLLKQGMWHVEQAHDECAGQAYARALELSDALSLESSEGVAPEIRLMTLGNRSFALMMNGRLDEAWRVAHAFRDALEQWPHQDSPYIEDWRAIFHGHMGLLLGRSRRYQEAYEQLEQGLAIARSRKSQPTLALLLRYAVDVSLSAGRFEQAFDWLRRQLVAERALKSDQASRLTALLSAEADTQSLRLQLDATNRQIEALERSNRQLAQQLRQADGASWIDARDFGSPALFEGQWAAYHAQARDHDVPCCVLLLSIDNHGWLASHHPASSVDKFLATLSRHLMSFDGLRGPPVRCSQTEIAMMLERVGSRRAAALAVQLVAVLNAVDWAEAVAFDLQPVFSCRHVDSAEYPDLNAAMAALRNT